MSLFTHMAFIFFQKLSNNIKHSYKYEKNLIWKECLTYHMKRLTPAQQNQLIQKNITICFLYHNIDFLKNLFFYKKQLN